MVLLSAGVFSVKAQDTKKEMDDKYVENDVVSLAGKKGFSFSTKAGDFLFKPYALVQASACYNRYDDQGLESHYAKSVANSVSRSLTLFSVLRVRLLDGLLSIYR